MFEPRPLRERRTENRSPNKTSNTADGTRPRVATKKMRARTMLIRCRKHLAHQRQDAHRCQPAHMRHVQKDRFRRIRHVSLLCPMPPRPTTHALETTLAHCFGARACLPCASLREDRAKYAYTSFQAYHPRPSPSRLPPHHPVPIPCSWWCGHSTYTICFRKSMGVMPSKSNRRPAGQKPATDTASHHVSQMVGLCLHPNRFSVSSHCTTWCPMHLQKLL